MTPKPSKIRVPDDIAGLIRGLHPHLKRKIKASLEAIVDEPHCGKPLKEELAGLRSLAVSRFRIVYRISEKGQIEVVAVGPRVRIYEETYRIMAREKQEC